jgi:hypothetical protein
MPEGLQSYKRTSITLKHEILALFSFLTIISPVWIRIRVPKANPDPNPDT